MPSQRCTRVLHKSSSKSMFQANSNLISFSSVDPDRRTDCLSTLNIWLLSLCPRQLFLRAPLPVCRKWGKSHGNAQPGFFLFDAISHEWAMTLSYKSLRIRRLYNNHSIIFKATIVHSFFEKKKNLLCWVHENAVQELYSVSIAKRRKQAYSLLCWLMDEALLYPISTVYGLYKVITSLQLMPSRCRH